MERFSAVILPMALFNDQVLSLQNFSYTDELLRLRFVLMAVTFRHL